MGKFVIGSSVDGYRVLVESFKGEVLAMSPFYESEEKATETIKLVKILIPNVKVYDETKGGHVLSKAPRFVIYRDSNDMYHFALEGGNAVGLLSSPAYTSFGYCVQMISNLRSI